MTTPLRLARERRGFTLKHVADSVDMDPANLSRVERGEQIPSKETVAALAKFFGHEVTEMQIIFPERYALPLSNKDI
ncbi:putative transcriptional regulator [Oxalobacteraceae bacterium GrIS 2.11]